MNNKIFRFPEEEAYFKNGISYHGEEGTIDSFLHTHDFYEIEYVLKGNGYNYLNGVEYPIEQGAIWSAGPKDYHRVRGNLQLAHIGFYLPDLDSSLCNLIGNLSFPLIGKIEDNEQEQLINLFNNLTKAFLKDDEYTNVEIKAIALEIFIFCARRLNLLTTKAHVATTLKNALSYINSHLNEQIKLVDVAKSIHLNASYFSDLFVREVGCNFVEYITRKRLESACLLLEERKTSITEIASIVGFGCVSTMNRAFKKYLNMSPSNYYKLNKSD